jgi:hypothetical protein
MTILNVLLWLVIRTVACRGTVAFVTQSKASQSELLRTS